MYGNLGTPLAVEDGLNVFHKGALLLAMRHLVHVDGYLQPDRQGLREESGGKPE